MHFYLEFKNSQQAHPESVAHSDLCSSTSLPDSFLLFKSISLVRWVGSKMACNDFYLLEVWKEESPVCNFFPLNVAGNCDLHLTNRIQQTWQDVTCMILLHKSVTSVLVADSLLKASCCVVSWTLEMPMWQGTEGSSGPQPAWNGGPQSSNSQGIEFCQQPCDLGSSSFSCWGSDETTVLGNTMTVALWDLNQRTQLSCVWTDRNCEITNVGWLKLLNLW